ncbi:MAG TPA: peptidoglycan glycosyltransferase, partial [Tissierella sp.]|nr:peptidoglycan glycosyltransferase [Tissierella sp.]
ESSSKIVKELLEEVVRSGTARKSVRLDDIGAAAGKTGSAEGLLKGKPTIYGWFAGYYPRDNPKYVITVLVEEANSGSTSAAPVFERICRKLK